MLQNSGSVCLYTLRQIVRVVGLFCQSTIIATMFRGASMKNVSSLCDLDCVNFVNVNYQSMCNTFVKYSGREWLISIRELYGWSKSGSVYRGVPGVMTGKTPATIEDAHCDRGSTFRANFCFWVTWILNSKSSKCPSCFFAIWLDVGQGHGMSPSGYSLKLIIFRFYVTYRAVQVRSFRKTIVTPLPVACVI